jgi:hypothetical protein
VEFLRSASLYAWDRSIQATRNTFSNYLGFLPLPQWTLLRFFEKGQLLEQIRNLRMACLVCLRCVWCHAQVCSSLKRVGLLFGKSVDSLL